MATWFWEARARTGELRKGEMEAETVETVQSRLRQQNLNPVRVRQKREINITIGSPVSDKDLVIFTRQFATMIDAGLPLVQCLEILATQGDNKAFNVILRDVKAHVEQGSTFSDALRRHPKVFDDLFVNLVQAGELGGILDTHPQPPRDLHREAREAASGRSRGALVYPIGIVVIAIGVLVDPADVRHPVVREHVQGLRQRGRAARADPARHRRSRTASSATSCRIILALVLDDRRHQRTATGRAAARSFWHRLLLNVPIIGPVMRKIAVARFTRTLGTLLGSGVPILDALDDRRATRPATSSSRKRSLYARTKIRRGQEHGRAARGDQGLPADGRADDRRRRADRRARQMLNKIADFYEEEVDVAVAALTSLLEPIMMVVIGGMVGVMLIAMYLPIFDIAGKIKAQ